MKLKNIFITLIMLLFAAALAACDTLGEPLPTRVPPGVWPDTLAPTSTESTTPSPTGTPFEIATLNSTELYELSVTQTVIVLLTQAEMGSRNQQATNESQQATNDTILTYTATPIPTPTITPIPEPLTIIPLDSNFLHPQPLARELTPYPFSGAVISSENADQLQQLARWGKGAVEAAAYSPSGMVFAVATSQGVYFYETNTFRQVRHLRINIPDGAVTFSNELSYVAVGTQNGAILIWRLDTGELVQGFRAEGLEIREIEFSPDEKILYTLDYFQQNIRMWDVSTGENIAPYRIGGDGIKVSGKNGTMAVIEDAAGNVGNDSRTVNVWRNNDLLSKILFPDIITDFALSPNGKLIAISSGWSEEIRIHDTSSGELVYQFSIEITEEASKPVNGYAHSVLRGGFNSFMSLEFSPDSTILTVIEQIGPCCIPLIGSIQQFRLDESETLLWSNPTQKRYATYSPGGNQLMIWDSSSLEILAPKTGNQIGDIDFSHLEAGSIAADGQTIAIHQDNRIEFRDANIGNVLNAFSGPESIQDFEISQDRSLMVTNSYDGQVQVWDLASRAYYAFDTYVCCGGYLSLSNDNHYLAIGRIDDSLRIIDLENGLISNIGSGDAFAFSLRTPHFATVRYGPNYQSDLVIYETADFSNPKVFIPVSGRVYEINFSPDGSLVCARQDYGDRLSIWEVNSQELVFETDKISGRSCAISPDSDLIAFQAGSNIEIWNVFSNRFVASIPTLYSASPQFSSDGTRLFLNLSDGTLSIWGIAP